MTGRKRRSAVCLAIKVAIIEAVEAGDKRKSEVAKSFDIPKSSLSSILRLRELFCASKFVPTWKRMRQGAQGELEEALFIWFRQARSMNVPMVRS